MLNWCTEKHREKMKGFLINKNLCLYYWLRKRIGKKRAFWVANTIGKGYTLSGLKKGMRVSVESKKDGDKNVAVAIKVPAPKAQPKKAEEMKPAEPEKK